MREILVHITNGEIRNKTKVRSVFTGLQDGPYLLTLKSKRRRSLSQNRYYWKILVPMVRQGLTDTGWEGLYDDMDAHEFIKKTFLRAREIYNPETDEKMEMTASTAKLTTLEFSELIEEIIRWGATYLSLQIPYPNEELVIQTVNQ